MSRWFHLVICPFLIALILSTPANAETLHFADGSSVQAKLLTADVEGLQCLIDQEEMLVRWSFFEYREIIRLWALARKGDTSGFFELAEFCFLNKQYKDARQYFTGIAHSSSPLAGRARTYLERISQLAEQEAIEQVTETLLETVAKIKSGNWRSGLKELQHLLDNTEAGVLAKVVAETDFKTRANLEKYIKEEEGKYYRSMSWEFIDGKWMSPAEVRRYRAAISCDPEKLCLKYKALLQSVYGTRTAAPQANPGKYFVVFANYDIDANQLLELDHLAKFCSATLGAKFPEFEPFPLALLEGRKQFHRFLVTKGVSGTQAKNIHTYLEKDALVTYGYLDNFRLTNALATKIINSCLVKFHEENGWVSDNISLFVEFTLAPDTAWRPWIVNRARKKELTELEKLFTDWGGKDIRRRSTGIITSDRKKEIASFIFFLATSPKYRESFRERLELWQAESWRTMFPADEIVNWQNEWTEYFQN
ncbi:hypothetical protein ACFL54_04015 [Planctomycetota bacterium]